MELSFSFNKPAAQKLGSAVGLRIRIDDGKLYFKPANRTKGFGMKMPIVALEDSKTGGRGIRVSGVLADKVSEIINGSEGFGLTEAPYKWLAADFGAKAPLRGRQSPPFARIRAQEASSKRTAAAGKQSEPTNRRKTVMRANWAARYSSGVDEMVLAYLHQHPDFLTQHPELLDSAKPVARRRKKAASGTTRRAPRKSARDRSEKAEGGDAAPARRRPGRPPKVAQAETDTTAASTTAEAKPKRARLAKTTDGDGPPKKLGRPSKADLEARRILAEAAAAAARVLDQDEERTHPEAETETENESTAVDRSAMTGEELNADAERKLA